MKITNWSEITKGFGQTLIILSDQPYSDADGVLSLKVQYENGKVNDFCRFSGSILQQMRSKLQRRGSMKAPYKVLINKKELIMQEMDGQVIE